jgi:membrane-associated phospholipid phosphatase
VSAQFIDTLRANLAADLEQLRGAANLLAIAAAGAAAWAVHPEDQAVEDLIAKRPAVPGGAPVSTFFGHTYTILSIGAIVYAVGRERGPRLGSGQGPGQAEALGMKLVEASVLSESVTQSLKYTIRRERPFPKRTYSFPSGHAMVTFAAATVVEKYLGRAAGITAHVLAGYVAFSRVRANRHYASDVVFGSLVGMLIGRSVIAGEARVAASPATLEF